MKDDIQKLARKLTRITGHMDISVFCDGRGRWIAWSAYSAFVVAYGATPRAAGNQYLKENVDRIRRFKMEEQGGRCKFCTSTGPLQLDHIKPRSKGRDDRLENLQLLCAYHCHNRKTGTLKWKGTI